MIRKILIGLILGLVVVSVAGAEIPKNMNFQGRVTPVPGAGQNIIITFYDAQTEGNVKYQDTFIIAGPQDSLPIVYPKISVDGNGIFNILLGRRNVGSQIVGAPLPEGINLTLDYGQQLWVEIIVNNTTLPRQRLTSVPFALVADVADNLSPGDKIFHGNITITGNLTVEGTTNLNNTTITNLTVTNTATLTADTYIDGNTLEQYITQYSTGGAVTAPLHLSGDDFIVIKGESTHVAGIGVHGIGKTGVSGHSGTVEGFGVFGTSTYATGVKGTGATGGLFISAGGVGVKGSGGTAGGSFESTSGVGVSGTGVLAGSVGVRGKGVTAGGSFESTGVLGVGVSGTGVLAGSVGVRGKGATAGGSFESTSGVGVSGTGVSAGSVGVRGKGAIGIKGETTSTSTGYAGEFNGPIKLVPQVLPTAETGKMYFDQGNSRIRYFDGSSWIQIDPVFTSKPIKTSALIRGSGTGSIPITALFTPSTDIIITAISGRIGHTDGSYLMEDLTLTINGGSVERIKVKLNYDSNQSSLPIYLPLSMPSKFSKANAVTFKMESTSSDGGYYAKIAVQYIELPLQ